jgi:hypothetical protein
MLRALTKPTTARDATTMRGAELRAETWLEGRAPASPYRMEEIVGRLCQTPSKQRRLTETAYNMNDFSRPAASFAFSRLLNAEMRT